MSDTELTGLHQKLLTLLNELGVDYDLERPISIGGKTYQMDCYLPTYHVCVEADGPSHGLQGKKDKARDTALRGIGIETLRITAKHLETMNPLQVIRILDWLRAVEPTIDERRTKMRARDALLQ